MKINLDQLKNEIDIRNQEKGIVSIGGNTGISRKDNFLSELKTSLHHGVDTPAIQTIKIIENKAAAKNKERPIHNLNGDAPTPIRQGQPLPQGQRGYISEDRDEQMFNDLNKKVKNSNGLYNTINEMAGYEQPQQKQNYGGGLMLNEGAINEAAIKAVNNYLTENLAFVLEGAIKETILDLYAMDRIKQVINESPEMMEGIIINTLRKLQNKSKK